MAEVTFVSFEPDETVPVEHHLRKKKLLKFFNRETAAVIVCADQLLSGRPPIPDIPVYYATGTVEREDFGLELVVKACRDESGRFSQRRFVEKGLSSISPLNQFKVLYNMPLCFLSIEHGLTGDNAVIYSAAAGLLLQAQNAPWEGPLLVGAGKLHRDGRVEAGFALVRKEELPCPADFGDLEAIEIFRRWAGKGNGL